MKPSLSQFLVVSTVGLMVASLVVTFIVQAVFLGRHLDAHAEDLAELHLRSMRARFEATLDGYSREIGAVSRSPMLVHGVMQPETHLRGLRNYIDRGSLGAEDVSVAVLSFDGTVLHKRTSENSPSLDGDEEIVKLLNGEASSVSRVRQGMGRAVFRVAVPILRSGLTEGALVVDFPMAKIAEALTRDLAPKERVQLAFNGNTIFASDHEIEPAGWSAEIPGTSLELRYEPNMAPFRASAANFELRLAAVFALGVVIVLLLALTLARRNVAAPFARFVESLERVGRDDREAGLPTRQVFSEFERVAVRFNQVIQRFATTQGSLRESNRRLDQELSKLSGELERSRRENELFAATVANDLQEPMRRVSMSCRRIQQVLDERPDDALIAPLELAIGETDRMKDLIGDVLAYSRMIGREEEFEDVDLDACCDTALEALATELEALDVKLSRDPLPQTRANPALMTELFRHLISNAIRYRADRALEIHIGPIETNSGPGVFVSDNGIGIDSHRLERIFEIFKRVDPRSYRKGNGIGLASCKKIVESHGGRIWAESEPDSGSRFIFSLGSTP